MNLKMPHTPLESEGTMTQVKIVAVVHVWRVKLAWLLSWPNGSSFLTD
ncbi:hypothetical protein COLO4_28846 [Corchorus olitorius]|uniref:Uncharacterized protein n=1 Tax=Corchorus olitorius TaxID=93759 RepID=A0A1R3HHY8_9ROSI|nr:hypothetical protein COLO4_28846 [Corchorus olitorius]